MRKLSEERFAEDFNALEAKLEAATERAEAAEADLAEVKRQRDMHADNAISIMGQLEAVTADYTASVARVERLTEALQTMVDDAGKSDYQVRRLAYTKARAALTQPATKEEKP